MKIKKHPTVATAVVVGAAAALLVACQSIAAPARPPLALAPSIDVKRFMGDWFVIANIPTRLEKGAHNAKETYKLDADGTIATTFGFRADSFDGPERSYTARGFVVGGNNAIWGMQFIWPVKADYRIAYVSEGYGITVVAREKRDYVWIMARTPTIPQAEYERLVAFIGQQGYDTARIQRVPQQPR